MVCKRSWFLKLKKLHLALEGVSPSQSYYECKHPTQASGRQRYIEFYQSEKSRLRGDADPTNKISMFFEQIQNDPDHDHLAAHVASDVPLAAWLVTPRRWTDFIVEG